MLGVIVKSTLSNKVNKIQVSQKGSRPRYTQYNDRKSKGDLHIPFSIEFPVFFLNFYKKKLNENSLFHPFTQYPIEFKTFRFNFRNILDWLIH